MSSLRMHEKDYKHKNGIAYRFNKAASNYERFSIFQKKCGIYLCNRVDLSKSKFFLDAGCGTGWFSRYWKSQNKIVFALDISENMLFYAKKYKSADAYILGDVEYLPFGNKTLDVIFSNLVLQWCSRLSIVLSEFYRVLRPGGIALISIIIDGSLIELKNTWNKIDNDIHLNNFISKTNLRSIFSLYKHSLNFKSYTLYYSYLIDLLKEIKGTGAGYLYAGRKSKLTSRAKFNKLESLWPQHKNKLFISYQIAYGVLYRD